MMERIGAVPTLLDELLADEAALNTGHQTVEGRRKKWKKHSQRGNCL